MLLSAEILVRTQSEPMVSHLEELDSGHRALEHTVPNLLKHMACGEGLFRETRACVGA